MNIPGGPRDLPAATPPPPPAAPPQWGEGLPPHLVYPWDPPEKQPGTPPTPPRRRFPYVRVLLLVLLVAIVAVVVRLLVFMAAVSTVPLWSAHFWPFAGGREANVLVLGYGGQGHDGAYLTDSLVLLHSDLPSAKTAEISIPRDLWVQVPPDSGRYAKINSAYAYGRASANDDPAAGGQLATLKVGQVTGLPVDRWATIDFQGFRALVDALGGVDVNVERSFTAQYPANDDPAIDPSWITVSFTAGRQHMNGETAIRYARARYAEQPEEASDFARSQRQQRLVAAIAAKVKRPTSWWRVFGVLNALQPALRTNLSPADLAVLFLRANIGGANHIALTTDNVLAGDTSADGQAILIPRNNDYGAIIRYIHDQLNK
ncbi:MAG: LCP family protein [Thermomicrobiales bacterium]